MRKVLRDELLEIPLYERERNAIRRETMKQKKIRRVHVGDTLTFLFENADTVRYQIQEMIRAEGIRREKDVWHEVETYNGLLGGPGEIGATLLIEIDSPEERAEKLARWKDLPQSVYLLLENGTRVRPQVDPGQIGERRVSSVQYLKFFTGGEAPVAVGSDHPESAGETRLSEEQRAALSRDLFD